MTPDVSYYYCAMNTREREKKGEHSEWEEEKENEREQKEEAIIYQVYSKTWASRAHWTTHGIIKIIPYAAPNTTNLLAALIILGLKRQGAALLNG